MIDTASVYKNEESVGRAIAKCGVPRKDLFITSKIWNNAQRLGDVQGAFSRSLDRLKVSYVDLYLIHWPVPGCYLSTWKELESILETVFPYILQETFLLRLKRLSDIIQSYWQRLYTLSVLSISSSLYIRMKYMSLRLTLVLQEPFLISVR